MDLQRCRPITLTPVYTQEVDIEKENYYRYLSAYLNNKQG